MDIPDSDGAPVNMHAIAPGIHAGVVAFLRHGMSAKEQAYARFENVLRRVSEVPIGELRVHPDLIDRVVALDVPDGRRHLRMLMGAAVLVADSGRIFALAYSQQFLALRRGTDASDASVAAVALPPTARAQQAPQRIATLGDGWIVVDPWAASTETLTMLVAMARDGYVASSRRNTSMP